MTKPELGAKSGPPPPNWSSTTSPSATAPRRPRAPASRSTTGRRIQTGDEFDSSWNRGQSIEFPLNGLIAGWQEGILA